jgi:hypothetical protein
MYKVMSKSLDYECDINKLNKINVEFDIYVIDDKAIVVYQGIDKLMNKHIYIDNIIDNISKTICSDLLYDYNKQNIIWLILSELNSMLMNNDSVELKRGINLISREKTSYDFYNYSKRFETLYIADSFDEFFNKVEELSKIYNYYKDRNGFFAYSFNFLLISYYKYQKINSIIKPMDFPRLLLSKKNMINNVALYFEKESCKVYKNIYVCDRKTIIKKDLMVVSSHKKIIYCNIYDENTIYPYLKTYDQLIDVLNDEDNDSLLYNIINSLKITQNLFDIVSTDNERNIKLSNMIILKNGKSIILELDSDEDKLYLIEDLYSYDNLMDYKETISKVYLSNPSYNFFQFTANTLKYFSLLYDENKQRKRQNRYY